VVFLCAYFGISSNDGLIIILISLFITYCAAWIILDRYYPHYNMAMISDDPDRPVRVFDENDNEIEAEMPPSIIAPGPSTEKRVENDDFQELLAFIEKDFDPRIIRDDDELKSRLISLLNNRYSGRYKTDAAISGEKIDILVDDKYGIGLRTISDEEQLRALIGDAAFLANTDTAFIVFIDRLLSPRIDLEEYTKKFEDYGVTVIIKEGMIERPHI
jgi:hypothetical protein